MSKFFKRNSPRWNNRRLKLTVYYCSSKTVFQIRVSYFEVIDTTREMYDGIHEQRSQVFASGA